MPIGARPIDNFQCCIKDVVKNAVKKKEQKLQGCRDEMEAARVFLNNEEVKLSYATLTKAMLVEDISRKCKIVRISEDFIVELLKNKDNALEIPGVCEQVDGKVDPNCEEQRKIRLHDFTNALSHH